MPLITPVIVIIHIVINDRLDSGKPCAFIEFCLDVVFHMSEEAFLWGIIPAVPSARHGLAQLFITKDPDKTMACIVATLVAVDDRFCVQ